MRDGIGLAEARHEFVTERNAGDQLAVERITHLLRRRKVGVAQHSLFQPDLVQHAEDVGAELDAGADLAEFGRLLENAHRETLARQREGRDQAADAAAGHKNGRRVTIVMGHDRSFRRG